MKYFYILITLITCTVGASNNGNLEKKTNIVIVLMVKNEADVICKTLEPFVASGFDQFFIYDTGSTDNTQQIAINYFNQNNIKHYHIAEEPFINFADSRNRALRLTEEFFPENNFMLMLDAEWYTTNPEILTNFCKEHEHDMTPAYLMRIVLGDAECYTPRLLRMHQNVCFKGKVHEIPDVRYCGRVNPEVYFTYAPSQYGREKSFARWKRDAEILLKEHEENKTDSRTAFYLAQTYECLSMHKEAFNYYTKRTELVGSLEEDSVAWYRRGKMAEKLYEETEDSDWYATAIQSYIHSWNMYQYRIEPAVHLARLFISEQEFKPAYLILKEIFNTPYPTPDKAVLILEKPIYEFIRYELMSICAWYRDRCW